jgi:paraquat-inducible protein B
MSKPVSPVAIGGFTVGALFLLIVGIFIFGGSQMLNNDEARFVIFFDSSLNGLEKGAPVKMQGVKIGEVTDIALQIDAKNAKVYKPVVITIDRNSFIGTDGVQFERAKSHQQQITNRDRLVKAGFRARLEMQSLLTGLLYVDLDVYPDKPPLFINENYHNIVELPSVLTTTDELRNTAEEVVEKIRKLPLDEMIGDLASTLREVRNLLSSEETKKSKQALANTLQETEKTIKTLNANLEPLLKDTHKTVVSTNALVQDSRAMIQDVHQDIRPVLASADKTLNAATAALVKAQDSLEKVGNTVGPDSALHETLESLRDASRSIKDLTDYLERHPEAVLSGKNP